MLYLWPAHNLYFFHVKLLLLVFCMWIIVVPFIFVIITVVYYGLPVSCDYASIEEYIINGEDASKGDWPWQLSLEVLDPEFRHTCGASLLDSRHALTAGQELESV